MNPCERKTTRPAKPSTSCKRSILEEALQGVIEEELLRPSVTLEGELHRPSSPAHSIVSISSTSSLPDLFLTPEKRKTKERRSTFAHLLSPLPALLSMLSPSKDTPSTSSPLSDPVHPSYDIPQPCQSKESPSTNFKTLQSIRRKSFHPKTQCSYVIKKGKRKGERCNKFCETGELVCKLHSKPKTKCVSSPPPPATLFKLRINRLKTNKRYFFVRQVNQHGVILRCKDKSYILTLPRGMVNPEHPTKRDYLIRKPCGETVWELGPSNIVN